MTHQTRGITPLSEKSAEGRIGELFAEIRSELRVSEVPLFYRIIAHIPLYLETSWRRFSFRLAGGRHARTHETKWMIALAISASNNNRPMIVDSTSRLKELGATDTQLAELMAVVDVVNGMNKTLKAAGIK